MNSIIFINFNMLYFFCEAKKAGVQNFEPHPIIKKLFKNNSFLQSSIYPVKNYEPGLSILGLIFLKKADA